MIKFGVYSISRNKSSILQPNWNRNFQSISEFKPLYFCKNWPKGKILEACALIISECATNSVKKWDLSSWKLPWEKITSSTNTSLLSLKTQTKTSTPKFWEKLEHYRGQLCFCGNKSLSLTLLETFVNDQFFEEKYLFSERFFNPTSKKLTKYLRGSHSSNKYKV